MPSRVRRSFRSLPPVAVLALAVLAGRAAPAAAQDETMVERLAPVLAAEDARRWDGALFERSLAAPEPLVRRVAAMSVGRVGDWRGTPLLVRALIDPDSSVQAAAAFALGLLRDTAAIEPLTTRLTSLPTFDAVTATEAVTALARIGGPRVADFFARGLQGSLTLTVTEPDAVRQTMAWEAWRLGDAAPAGALLPLLRDGDPGMRRRVFYSAGRLRLPGAGRELLTALRDQDSFVRAHAARTLTRRYAREAGLGDETVITLLRQAVDDGDPGVRVNAMRSLGSFADSASAARVGFHLQDPMPNVQVQAAATLGDLGGAAAVRELERVARGRDFFALQREALLSLARLDSAAFTAAARDWAVSTDWRHRAAVAEGRILAGDPGAAPAGLADRDPRVVAASLQAWGQRLDGPDPRLLGAARARLGHADQGVRTAAATLLARAGDPADLPALAGAYRRALQDSVPDAAMAALEALAAIARGSDAARVRVEREFFRTAGRPADYLLRAWAETNWPELSRLWGPAYPLDPGRTLQDYREIVRRFVITPPPQSTPHVFIDTDQRGTIELELFGNDAPLTVANFLRLVDRRFFDGNRWHRVVPNFVVQDGDPRGDGSGGPGGAIRDEINRHRYDGPVLGMALSGPDTGSSQWFINLSPQPHLDGIYTVFGRVVDGQSVLVRITQGDLIRSIHR